MIAVDTNILVYAVDTNEPVKGPKAAQLLRDLGPERTVLLWHVVCEFGAAMLRKKPKSEINIAIPDILTAWLGMFPLRVPSAAVIPAAWRLIETHQLSYWDALLFAACIDAGVTRLYTEDMQSRTVIDGVEIVNPFAGPSPAAAGEAPRQ